MRISAVLRQPASRDLSKKYDESIRRRFEEWDLHYIEEKVQAMHGQKAIADLALERARHPADEDDDIDGDCEPFLVRRVAKANTQRRQILHYLKGHHERISQGIENEIPDTLHNNRDRPSNVPPPSAPEFANYHLMHEDDRPYTVASTAHETTNSTLLETPSMLQGVQMPIIDASMSDSGGTQTTFAISERTVNPEYGITRQRLQFPPPPREAGPIGENSFLCHLC